MKSTGVVWFVMMVTGDVGDVPGVRFRVFGEHVVRFMAIIDTPVTSVVVIETRMGLVRFYATAAHVVSFMHVNVSSLDGFSHVLCVFV